MKITLPFLAVALIVATSSCSSAYKAAQTPDDVYYSPSSKKVHAVSGDDQPEYYSTNNPNDQYVQLKVEDQARWSYFDDYNYYDSYYYTPLGSSYGNPYYGSGYGYYGAGMGFGFGGFSFLNPTMYWSSYYSWNSFYNPYFYNPYYGGGMILVNPKYGSYAPGYGGGAYTPYTTAYTGLRTFNPASYRPAANTARGSNRFYTPAASRANGNNANGNNIYNRGTNQNNNTNNTYYRPPTNNTNFQPSSQPVRSYTPSSAPSSGGGGGGISRPGRN